MRLTNHSYFNLAGHGAGSALAQLVKIEADYYCTNGAIPMADGAIAPVEGTPMDFRTFSPVGRAIHSDFAQLRQAGGFNHTYVLRKRERGALELAASMYDSGSGRKMEVYTTMPGLHFLLPTRPHPVPEKAVPCMTGSSDCALRRSFSPIPPSAPGFLPRFCGRRTPIAR